MPSRKMSGSAGAPARAVLYPNYDGPTLTTTAVMSSSPDSRRRVHGFTRAKISAVARPSRHNPPKRARVPAKQQPRPNPGPADVADRAPHQPVQQGNVDKIAPTGGSGRKSRPADVEAG